MNKYFNNRIAEIRRMKDLTQADLAGRSGLPQPIISRAEAGQSSIEVKCRVAEALDLSVQEVFPDMPTVLCKKCQKRDFGVHVSTYNEDAFGFDLCWKCCKDAASEAQSALARYVKDVSLFVTADDLLRVIDLAKRAGFDQDFMPGYRRAAPPRAKNPKEKKLSKEEKAAIRREETIEKIKERIIQNTKIKSDL